MWRGSLEVALDVDAAILKCGGCLSRCSFQSLAQFVFGMNDAHAPATAAGGCFYDNRKSNLARQSQPFGFRRYRFRTARKHRQAGFRHRASSFNLVAHQTNDVRRRANELDIAGGADFGKVGRLGQEPVTWMNRVDVENFCGTDDGGNIQVTLSGRRRANACCFIGKAHMKRIAIDVAMDGDRADAHLFARPNNTTGNLAAIGDQYLLELSNFRRHLLSKVQCPKSKVLLSAPDIGLWTLDFGRLLLNAEQRLAILNRLSILDVNLGDLAACLGLNFIHQLHRLDDADNRIRFDRLPIFTNESAFGDAAR